MGDVINFLSYPPTSGRTRNPSGAHGVSAAINLDAIGKLGAMCQIAALRAASSVPGEGCVEIIRDGARVPLLAQDVGRFAEILTDEKDSFIACLGDEFGRVFRTCLDTLRADYQEA